MKTNGKYIEKYIVIHMEIIRKIPKNEWGYIGIYRKMHKKIHKKMHRNPSENT